MNSEANPEYYPRLSKEAQYWELNRFPKPFTWEYLIQIDDKNYHIFPFALAVEWEDGSSLCPDFVPEKVFLDCVGELTEDQLFEILALPLTGKRHSFEEDELLYQEFLKLENREQINYVDWSRDR